MAIPGSYLAELRGVVGLNELFDIDPDRADLVSSPAIGRRFLLIKAKYSDADWEKTKESDYTIEQLAQSVPTSIRKWAEDKAKIEERDLEKSDLVLSYKNPNGIININGVVDARQSLEQITGIPEDVIKRAKEELDGIWHGIQNNTNKEELDMKDLVKKILGFSSKVEKSDFGEKASALLGDITDALNKGQIDKEKAAGLLAEIEKAFDGNNISEEQFNNWSGEVAKALPEAKVEAEVETEVEEVEETVVEETQTEEAESNETEAEVEEEAEEVVVAEEETEEAEVEKKAPEEDPNERIQKYENDLKDAQEEIRKAHEEIQKMKIEKKRNDLIKKSEIELKYIGKSAEDTADLFISLHKAGVPKDVFDKVYDYLKAANEMIDKSGFFDEKGTALENEELDGDPDAQLMKEAQGLVETGEYDTVEKAYAAILTKDPSWLEKLERE